MPPISGAWAKALEGEFHKPYYKKLFETVGKEYATHQIFPAGDDIFNAFHFTPLDQVKVVILGQDPYHGDGQAHGLCFSVKRGVMPPPSLKNIFTEIHSDLGIDFDMSVGELTDWARQGVLMLNTSLTVREGMAGSHRGKGWEILTDRIIELLNERDVPTAFILWGNNAKSKMPLITNPKHAVFTAAHPSPLSAYNGFFGCRHFSKVNEFLKNNGIEPIDWSIH